MDPTIDVSYLLPKVFVPPKVSILEPMGYGPTTLPLRKLERMILHLINSSTWLPPLRKDKVGDTKV